MNTIYLMIDEKNGFAAIKIGFATDMKKRLYQYTTHNPFVYCRDTVKTQAKSGRDIEKSFHNEMLARGYAPVTARMDGKRTEWFIISYSDPFYAEIQSKGLMAFTTGRNRKSTGGWGC